MTVTDDITRLTKADLPDDWTELDKRAVDTARLLAADAVQKVGNGHPGTAMSLAPLAYTLFQRVLRHDPADPDCAEDLIFKTCNNLGICTPGQPGVCK